MSFLESNTVIKFADFLITYYRQNKILDILRTITGSELFAGIKCLEQTCSKSEEIKNKNARQARLHLTKALFLESEKPERLVITYIAISISHMCLKDKDNARFFLQEIYNKQKVWDKIDRKNKNLLSKIKRFFFREKLSNVDFDYLKLRETIKIIIENQTNLDYLENIPSIWVAEQEKKGKLK